jgi:hypothetical protein
MRMLMALALTACLGAHASTATWDFRVLLDGRDIGRHTFTRDASGDGARVVSEASFDVRVLFLSVYRYEHHAEELWRGGCLVSLQARTDDNGERKDVNARPGGCISSFAYWDPVVVRAERLLNAQTGEVVPVRTTALGMESIQVRGRPISASRYRLRGPALAIDLWYAGAEWVALESSLEGGRRLRYELR